MKAHLQVRDDMTKLLNRRPAFTNYYKTGIVFKWVDMDDSDYEDAFQLIIHIHPYCAIKKCSMNGFLVWVPRPESTIDDKRFWLSRAVGESYLESLSEMFSYQYASNSQRLSKGAAE